MTITLETELVRQCAPTLAGLKAASLFRSGRQSFCPDCGNPPQSGAQGNPPGSPEL